VNRLLGLASLALVVALLLRPKPTPSRPELVPLAASFRFDSTTGLAGIRFAVRNQTSGDILLLGCGVPVTARPPFTASGPMVLVERHEAGGWRRYATVRECSRRDSFVLMQDSSRSLQFVVRAPGRYRAVLLWHPMGRFGNYRRVATEAIEVGAPASVLPPNHGL
jgi:hypothetical protein